MENSHQESTSPDIGLLSTILEIKALKHCLAKEDRIHGVPLGEQICDDDYRFVIREFFADCSEYSEDLLEPILMQIKEQIATRKEVEDFGDILKDPIFRAKG